MKTVYFVRHGESEENVGTIYGVGDSPLTERGREQARFVAKRCTKLPIETIVSSTLPRALETAQIISELTGVAMSSAPDIFFERRKPTEIIGKSYHNSEAQKLNATWWHSLNGTGERATDGENFTDMSERAGEALEHLSSRSEKHILVVTHGFFLKFVVARAMYSEGFTSEQFAPLMRSLRSENTGITVLLRNDQNRSHEVGPVAEWLLSTWNDHAHLG